MNKDLPKWCQASVNSFFANKSRLDPVLGTIPLFCNGENLTKILETKARIELRMNGPHLWEIQKNNTRIDLDVGFLISVKKDPRDLYAINRIAGLCGNMLETLPIYNYGDGTSLLFCMNLLHLFGRMIRIDILGEIEVGLLQASVTGVYRGYYKE